MNKKWWMKALDIKSILKASTTVTMMVLVIFLVSSTTRLLKRLVLIYYGSAPFMTLLWTTMDMMLETSLMLLRNLDLWIDVKRLISEAKARDIKIVLDFVNHTSDEHQAFLNNRVCR